VTHSFKAVLAGNGVPAEKIAVVRNGADLARFTPGPKPQGLVERHGLAGRFVAAYVGTVGMAHGLRTILDTAEKMKGDERMAFVIVGDGAERATLEAEAKHRGLANVVFVGPVGKDEVVDYLRLADAALVLLRDQPVFRHVIPSKMFEAMAVERPVVLGVLGESADLLEAANAGIVIQPESVDGLVIALTALAADRGRAAELGRNGRRFVQAELDRDKLAAQMLEELKAAAA
jgi:glycosyltransferase involved in cell wall biosynthesis